MAVQPWPTPDSDPTPRLAPAVLRRWDVILGIVFLLAFWGLGLGMGVKGLGVLGALLICAVSFLFPRAGLALALVLELALTTLTYFTAVNRAPEMRGADGVIGYELPFEFHAMVACVALLATAWAGNGFQCILSGQRWHLTSLERALIGVLTIGFAWTIVSAAYGTFFFPILYDLHVFLFWATAVLVARQFEGRRAWLTIVAVSAIGAVLHGLILLIDLTGPGIFASPEYLTDALRAIIGGSPDLAGTFVPVLLALDLLVMDRRSRWRIPLWIVAVILTFRTFATLSRSAMAMLFVSTLLLGLGLDRRQRPRIWRRVLGLVVAFGLAIGAVLVVAPSMGKAALFVVQERLLDITAGRERAQQEEYGFSTGRFSNADGSSDVYRELETEVALEQLAGDWLIGRGPGATINKRFRGTDAVSTEAYLHNGYLWYVLKIGLLGLAFVLWAYVAFFRVALTALRRTDLEPWERALTLGYAVSIAPILLAAWTNNIIGAPTGLYFLVPGFAWMCYLERTRLGVVAVSNEQPVMEAGA